MNNTEFEGFMATMANIWPAHKLTEGEYDRWRDNTRLMRYDQATDVISTLERANTYWPSFAEFHGTWRSLFLQPEIHDSPVFTPQTEEERANVKQLIVMMRGALKTTAGEHWHGGPEPCPVCGGIAPGKGEPRKPDPQLVHTGDWPCPRCDIEDAERARRRADADRSRKS